MRYEVYFSKSYTSKGKLIGRAKTRNAAIEMGASHPEAGFFEVWDTRNKKWI